jgi:hypothetical protein
MKIKNFIKTLREWLYTNKLYVVADPNDNSITFSKALLLHIKNNHIDKKPRIFVFRIGHNGNYGFMVDPKLEKETVMCDIQENAQYKCVGFESLCPTVQHIFYYYGLPADKQKKLKVSIHKTKDGDIYYQLENS